MIHLMGMKEHIKASDQEGDIEVKFTGLRPGEKLYEELLIGDNVEGTGHQKIMTAKEHNAQMGRYEHSTSKAGYRLS